MSSTASRGQLVNDALSMAGRSSELKSAANGWLNYWLQYVGLNFRFPELRKTGTQLTLAAGTSTVDLPDDFGSGMEKQGMIFGDNNKPMAEYSFEEFATQSGFPVTTGTTGRPEFYCVDKEAGVFRFGATADQNYAFTPTYFINPPTVDVDLSNDSEKVWFKNDLITVMGLVWMIYIFTNDERENAQEARVNAMMTKWQRESVKMGGTSRILLSPRTFKTTAWRGYP